MTDFADKLDDLATRIGQEFLIGMDDIALIREAATLLRTRTPSADPGRVMVPREPTQEMVQAGVDALASKNTRADAWLGPDGILAQIYRAMLAASPTADATEVDNAQAQQTEATPSPAPVYPEDRLEAVKQAIKAQCEEEQRLNSTQHGPLYLWDFDFIARAALAAADTPQTGKAGEV